MRLGLFGGSFNPPHVGHLVIAEAMREAASLDRVVWMPAATPPHKIGQDLAPPEARLALVRAPTLAGGLAPQRPDLLLVRQKGDEPPVWHVLDAKYRLDARPDTLDRLGVPAPPPEALGALHRYRDALVAPDGRRPVASAAALYPWRDDGRYAGSRLASSLATLGVGALPTLPGATDALRVWMEDVVRG